MDAVECLTVVIRTLVPDDERRVSEGGTCVFQMNGGPIPVRHDRVRAGGRNGEQDGRRSRLLSRAADDLSPRTDPLHGRREMATRADGWL